MTAVHASPLSGSWYPKDRRELQDLVSELFEKSAGRTGAVSLAGARAFVAPHAGLIYSGVVAAATYRHALATAADRVIILGFSHRRDFTGVRLPEVDSIRTPVGESRVDRSAVRQLVPHPLFHVDDEELLCDHSVEIQLPVLQHVLPQATIVPVYVGRLTPEQRASAARAIIELLEPGTLLVASTDLTHYGRSFRYQPFPADTWVAERLRELDFELIEAAGSLNPALFLDTLQRHDATLCGYLPVSLLLEVLRQLPGEEIFQQTLDYQTSGEITDDFSHSVSYGAMGYYPASAFHLAAEDQELLLESAVATLGRLQATGERVPIPPRRITPAMGRKAPVFVSLHQRAELRGCIGCRMASKDLASSVPELTLSAALEDRRFHPVTATDEDLEVEIHVLTPMKRIADRSELRLHEHGACLESYGRAGLLLPRVASDHNMTHAGFLEALARKAGLGPDAYESPETRLYVFRDQYFASAVPRDEAAREVNAHRSR